MGGPVGSVSSPASLTALGWLVGLGTTVLVIGTPYLRFAYFNPDLRLILDSLSAGVALLVAYLLWGRYARRRSLQDLLLAQGFLLLALSGLGILEVLHVIAWDESSSVDVWLPATLRLSGAVLVVASAFCGGRQVGTDGLDWRHALPLLVALAACVLLWVLRDALPLATTESPPQAADGAEVSGHPALLGVQAVSAAFFFLASVWFTLGASGRPDELLRLLGPASALAGFEHLNYLLYPSLYSGWLYTGDVLRTGAYLVLLLGAFREIGQYWSAQARAAVLEDRRRLARELHDGVVQELGFIRSQSNAIVDDPVPARDRVIAACDRALDEARAAVDALGRSPSEPLGFVLHRAARQVADRYRDTRVDVLLDDSVTAQQEQRHALVRITREAVSNAIRHGHASTVSIQLEESDDGRRLVVEDDGTGFDVGAVAQTSTGFGLMSMEERARGLRGAFEIESTPGEGTRVAVTW